MSSDFILQCAACGAPNRFPAERIGERARCGRCKAVLLLSHCLPQSVDDASFEAEVLSSTVPVVVEAWSVHCHICEQYTLSISRMASELCGKARVLTLEVDKNPAVPARYGVTGVPTLLLFKDGALVRSLVGPHSTRNVLAALGLT